MSTMEQCIESLVKFEKTHHEDIFVWMSHKVEKANKKSEECDVLDISTDNCLFSKIFAELYKVKRLATVARGDPEHKVEGAEVLHVPNFENDQLDELKKLGKFDIIILKEITHEAEDLAVFFDAVRSMLKDDDSRIFLFSHPKNPPVPVPDPAIPFWRKLAPNREVIIAAAKQIELGQNCFSASCPIKVEKRDWANILKCRYFPAVKKSEKCTDKEIRYFISAKPSRYFEFEEKLLMFLFTRKRIPGETDETEEEEQEPPVSPDESAGTEENKE